MRSQPNRLPETAPKGFGGAAIDRQKPLRFRLDGRIISGFAGDTVLSAALASGVDTLGTHRSSPIGLTLRAAPAISHASLASDPQRALPMARTPAQDGAEFVTLAGKHRGGLARLFQPGRTLGMVLDDQHALDRPWRAVGASDGPNADLLVVGAGVAGMAAALAGARAGLSVILAEANPHLGGHSGLFGTLDGEDSPEESVARLAAEVGASPAITVLPSTQVFSLRTGLARAHRIETQSGAVQGRVIDIRAPRIILATGSLERLPVFPGNRLPGVVATLDAYELATRYGVWAGQSALVATSSSPAYRLAMLASDAGIAIGRIFDSRPGPASRFIEFSRAYGMVQSTDAVPERAVLARAGGTLAVHTRRSETPHSAERLLVCGGWQPDLTLWHVAGGASHWHQGHARLEALGTLDAIVLAGSAAGYFSRRGCIQSGSDAIDHLLGRERRRVDDPRIDPLYETPDGTPGVTDDDAEAAPSYLDGGDSLLLRPAPPRRRMSLPFRPRRQAGVFALSEAAHPLAVCDVAAGVDLGLIPPEAAGIVAQERVALVPLSSAEEAVAPELPDTRPDTDVPNYLRGRFGPDARLVRLRPGEPRSFDPGALVYRSSDLGTPTDAVGVVLRETPEGTVALISAAASAIALPVTVRDKGVVQARIEPI
ncbi:sarcosine oxidase subunit alpha [Devosia lucknowensis]|uniref:Sarcosine oxidase subunit alpha n=1 Tax=Devosia lucknowensis TaxID=1096929 RepID=A0A1Y6EJM9_9HYPH|nr:FAD-dependent oxidoreductase [Devosia lucknowensis]SMQ61150.1 sarcosine oxidase subunit alpha [Devosia lucknowensis]